MKRESDALEESSALQAEADQHQRRRTTRTRNLLLTKPINRETTPPQRSAGHYLRTTSFDRIEQMHLQRILSALLHNIEYAGGARGEVEFPTVK